MIILKDDEIGDKI